MYNYLFSQREKYANLANFKEKIATIILSGISPDRLGTTNIFLLPLHAHAKPTAHSETYIACHRLSRSRHRTFDSLLAIACGLALERADSIIEDAPDSAYALLSAIDSDELRSDCDRAMYALLYTQARTKLNVVQTDDSLINTAVDYFAGSPDSREYMKALFYKGDIDYNRGNMTSAIMVSLHARDIAITLDDPYWRAKAAEQISYIYNDAHSLIEAMRYVEEAAKYYNLSGKNSNHLFSLVDVGKIAGQLGDSKREKAIYDSIIEIAEVKNDSILLAYCRKLDFRREVFDGNTQSALISWNKLKSVEHLTYIPVELRAYYANLLINNDSLNAAKDVLDDAYEHARSVADTIAVYQVYMNLNIKEDNYSNAQNYTLQLAELLNSDYSDLINQSPVISHRDYYKDIADYEKDKRVKTTQLLIAVIIITILIMSLIFVYYRLSIRIKDTEIENKINLISRLISQNKEISLMRDSLDIKVSCMDEDLTELKSVVSQQKGEIDQSSIEIAQLKAKHADVTQLKRVIESLFHEKWSTINLLCHEFFEKGDNADLRSKIVNSIDDELKKLMTDKSKHDIEKAVNTYMDGIANKLREQCQFIKAEDITFIIFIYAGFSQAICLFMDLKLKNYYNKRSRLTERILKSNATDKELFAAKLK